MISLILVDIGIAPVAPSIPYPSGQKKTEVAVNYSRQQKRWHPPRNSESCSRHTPQLTRVSIDSTENDLFTFRVGPRKQIFQVDKKTIAQASPVLDRMMNNGMKETQESTADLPEVEAATFITFLNYAYHSATPTNVSTLTSTKHTKKATGYGPLIALMLDAGFRKFWCEGCESGTELRFSKTFPVCSGCFKKQRTMPNHRAYCSGCNERYKDPEECFSGVLGSCCAENIEVLGSGDNRGYSEDQLLSIDVPQIDGMELFRFDVPILAKEVASHMRGSTSSRFSADPMAILKASTFADAYNIPSLYKLAILELFEALATRDVMEDSIADLIKDVYQNTPNSGFEAAFGSKHVLRRMLSMYVAYHTNGQKIAPAIAHAMATGGEFAVDLYTATALIAGGDLGKGWK